MTWRGEYPVASDTSKWSGDYGEIRNLVLETVQELGLCGVSDVLARLRDIPEGTVRRNLARLTKSGDLERVYRGHYQPLR